MYTKINHNSKIYIIDIATFDHKWISIKNGGQNLKSKGCLIFAYSGLKRLNLKIYIYHQTLQWC